MIKGIQQRRRQQQQQQQKRFHTIKQEMMNNGS